MGFALEKPEYWRMRAAETIALASETPDQTERCLLLDIAAAYERIRQRLEAGTGVLEEEELSKRPAAP